MDRLSSFIGTLHDEAGLADICRGSSIWADTENRLCRPKMMGEVDRVSRDFSDFVIVFNGLSETHNLFACHISHAGRTKVKENPQGKKSAVVDVYAGRGRAFAVRSN